MIRYLDGEWLLATDPQNVGREEGWWRGPVPDARKTKVPWIIQDAFPGYHGVAWYWREFVPPANPNACGRYLLRFWAVDYRADVWLNGIQVGGHEGGETPFVLDVSDAIQPEATNRLAVRVLNPTHDPIDGIVLDETPHRNKAVPFWAGASYNQGGIVDSVELVLAPAVRIEDLFARPDTETGSIRVAATLRNAAPASATCRLEFVVAPAASGEMIACRSLERELPPGDALIETEVTVDEPHLWDLNDPFLYRVTVRASVGAYDSVDEDSVRCGFRDFRFEDGYFRLNGRRIYLRCSHTGNNAPVGLQLPHDPDLFRRDLLNVKVMGFNAIRFIAGIATRYQLDLCDEIGLLVYEESYAGWLLGDSAHMAERFDRSTAEMIRRDRNHASVVIWGLLNETNDGPVFRHAVDALSLVRSLDDTRMVMLNGGRWDGRLDIGSLANPGSVRWEHLLGDEGPGASPTKMAWGGYCERMGDAHVYPRVPHTVETIRFLRTLGEDTKHVFLSEYGIGSAVDLWRVVRHYERLGKETVEDAEFYRERLDHFLSDWEAWRLEEAFASPAEYFKECAKKMAGQRTLGLNAIRANPNLVGYSLTGTVDQGLTGEGLFTTFRELKPGTVDALFDGFAPLRWCVFAEPANLYRGQCVRLEAVLADEDALMPGEYPVRLLVVGPDGGRVFDRTITVAVPPRAPEPPLARQVFDEEVTVDGPSGAYRFIVGFERGAAGAGGEATFFVSDPADIPAVEAEIALWGEDVELRRWLEAHGVRVRPFDSVGRGRREAILASTCPPSPGGAEGFRELLRRVAEGSTAIFLSPEVFKKGDDPVGWLPLAKKGKLGQIVGWLYLKDEWAKRHPLFDGLPSGGLMDYAFYREIIPDTLFMLPEPPSEAVAGAIRASQDYSSGLMASVHTLDAGRFVLNTLRIRENLGTHPAAERLLRNMLRYAAQKAVGPPAHLPPGFDRLLDEMGYRSQGGGR